jgi:hypothetical protein
VSSMDRPTRHRDRLLMALPESQGLAEHLPGVSEAGRDLFVSMAIGEGVPLTTPRCLDRRAAVRVERPRGLGVEGESSTIRATTRLGWCNRLE